MRVGLVMDRCRLSWSDLMELWGETGLVMRFAGWCNNEEFPDEPPLTPDDSACLQRLIDIRCQLLARMYRLFDRQERRRERRRRRGR